MTEQARKLNDKIIEVISRAKFQPNVPGADGKPTTWCNEAANAVLVEMGFDTKPILDPKGIGWTGATMMYDNSCGVALTGGAGVYEVSPRQAQAWANLGVPVLAAARRVIDDKKHSSHVGIVAPSDTKWSPAAGAWIGQAGSTLTHGFRSAFDSFVKWGLVGPRYFILPIQV